MMNNTDIDQIVKMKPGWELSALVETQFFRRDHPYKECRWCQDAFKGGYAAGNPHFGNYSEDPHEVSKVLCELVARGFEVHFRYVVGSRIAGRLYKDGQVVNVAGKTLEDLLCKFALITTIWPK